MLPFHRRSRSRIFPSGQEFQIRPLRLRFLTNRAQTLQGATVPGVHTPSLFSNVHQRAT